MTFELKYGSKAQVTIGHTCGLSESLSKAQHTRRSIVAYFHREIPWLLEERVAHKWCMSEGRRCVAKGRGQERMN